MSTRATYSLPTSLAQNLVLYVHHDGYPEGAAAKFNEVLIANPGITTLWAEAFIRTISASSVVFEHELVGDSEYRYTVDKDLHLVAEKREFLADGNERWTVFFEGLLFDFINQYRTVTYQGQVEEWAEPWFEVEVDTARQKKRWFCRSSLKAAIRELRDQAGDYLLRGMKENNPNLQHLRKELTILTHAYIDVTNQDQYAAYVELGRAS